MADLWYDSHETPIGRFWAAATDKGLLKVTTTGSEKEFLDSTKSLVDALPVRDPARFKELFRRLDMYFEGKPVSFSDLDFDLIGTDFQVKVWKAISEIPHGRVASYRDMAVRAGKPRAVRAAGSAVGDNKLLVVIPCHRVIKSDGSLGGFGGDTELKRRLLRLEGVKRF